MCGIAGFTHFNQRPAEGILLRAIESIRHRGPNQQGVFETASASIGAVRLKIIDLEGGDQPMIAKAGDLAIAFNGEIYNHVELRRELEKLGHQFRSHCDTEVVLNAFAQWDVQCFERLRGMFAVAFWEESRQRLVIARDRLGIKPLYYGFRNGNLHFGSELKAIFAHPDFPRQLSEVALGYFLSLNYVPTPYTLVEGITKVLPGTWLEFVHGAVNIGRYWRNEFRVHEWSLEEATKTLDRLLSESVAEHLISDVPLGIWASGGLDSSAILHYAAQATSKIQTFSISFEGRRFDESRFFRLLAKTYGTSHHEFDLNSDVDLTGAIQDIAFHSDEPSADAGALPVWFLSKMTARHVTVALSGEGADEVFAGYQTYLADEYATRARLIPKPLLQLALRLAKRMPVSDEKIGFEYKLKRFLAGALLSQDEAHFYWNGTFSQDERRGLGVETSPQRLETLVNALDGTPPLSEVVNRYLFVDQHYYLPDDILYKCDRMSMAHSLEVRPPFLDHRIVEFAASLPTHLKVSGGKTKFVMRELLSKKLPPEILERRKEGLDIPAHDWLRGPLKPLVEEALGSESVKRAGILSPAAVRKLVHRHMTRQANLGYHLWGLLTLHLWMQRWNISAGPVPEALTSQAEMVSVGT